MAAKARVQPGVYTGLLEMAICRIPIREVTLSGDAKAEFPGPPVQKGQKSPARFARRGKASFTKAFLRRTAFSGKQKAQITPSALGAPARVQDSQQGAGSPAVLLQIGRHGTGVHGCRYTACMEIRAFPIIKRICLQYRVSGNKGPPNIYR